MIIPMGLLIFEGEADLGKWITISIGIIGFIVLVASALIIILSKKRDDVVLMSEKRAEQAEKLLKLKDDEIKGLNENLDVKEHEIDKLNSDLSILKGDYTAVVGIIIKDVIDFYVNSNNILKENEIQQLKITRLLEIINTLDVNYFKDNQLRRNALKTLRELDNRDIDMEL